MESYFSCVHITIPSLSLAFLPFSTYNVRSQAVRWKFLSDSVLLQFTSLLLGFLGPVVWTLLYSLTGIRLFRPLGLLNVNPRVAVSTSEVLVFCLFSLAFAHFLLSGVTVRPYQRTVIIQFWYRFHFKQFVQFLWSFLLMTFSCFRRFRRICGVGDFIFRVGNHRTVILRTGNSH